MRLWLQRSRRTASLDHGESTIGKLIVAAVLALAAGIAPAANAPTFAELKWTVSDAEYAVLANQPLTCFAYSSDLEQPFQAGRALFFAPTVLSGQAAKAGLSCASCHANGRDNPHFLLTGVSDKPGTADVTNSFFSAARGNGRFDPVAIPDLALPGKISRKRGDPELEKFIRDLIVDEFGGEEPSFLTLEALATYVRSIKACEANDKQPVALRLYDQIAIIEGVLDVADKYATAGKDREAGILVSAARHQLGLIAERYAGPKLKAERALLLNASRELQRIAADASVGKTIAQWQSDFEERLAERLFRKESLSLYNPKMLAKAFPQKEIKQSAP